VRLIFGSAIIFNGGTGASWTGVAHQGVAPGGEGARGCTQGAPRPAALAGPAAGDAVGGSQTQVRRSRPASARKGTVETRQAAELIGGSAPKAEEVAGLAQYLKPGEKQLQLKGKIIDSYWNGVLQNSQLEQLISEKDEPALENLLNIQFAESEPNSICLRFVFRSNPYYEQTTAVRKLRMSEGQVVCLEGDLLTPKSGFWLTHECKKVTNKGTGETKQIQGKKIESFFDIFLNWNAV